MEENQPEMRVFEQKHNCVQGEAPFCTAACPLHVDVRLMMAHIQKENWEAALELYRSAVLLPGIVSRLCTKPCRGACLRAKMGDGLEIGLLERCLVETVPLPPKNRFIRPKNQSAIVVGAGLAGIACALTLAQKGFLVTLHANGAYPGGAAVMHPLLDTTAAITEIKTKLESCGVSLRLSSPVDAPENLPADVVLLAEEEDAAVPGGLLAGAGVPLVQNKADPHIFYATYLPTPERALAQGKQAARAMEQYLGGLTFPVLEAAEPKTRLYTPLAQGLAPLPATAPGETGAYTRQQAQEEARRCPLCECKACLPHCLFLQEGKQHPKQYIVEAQQSLRTLKLLQSKLKARRTNACNLCGLCREYCPGGVDMSEVYLYSRRIMHRQGELPEAFHAFWLEDMAFSQSEEAFLCKAEPGFETVEYLFFPGCQLGGVQPSQLQQVYAYLREHLGGGVGMHLGCCGAPAEWAGYEEQTQELLEHFRALHAKLGNPVVILACPSCEKLFAKYHADIRRMPLWQVFCEQGLPQGARPAQQQEVAVFDPCASRYSPPTQGYARRLLKQMGYAVQELPHHGRYAQCCGHGGLISASNPQMAKRVAADRVAASSLPYVSYCTNCCEIFRREGKTAWHLLDLLFGADAQNAAGSLALSYSARRDNRRKLKQTLLNTYWGEAFSLEKPQEWLGLALEIPGALRTKMEEHLILEENIQQAIYRAEANQSKLAQGEQFICHLQIGVVTYWVYYHPLPGGRFAVDNAYCHRMQIVEEAPK